MVPARSPRHPERELLRAAPRVTVTCSAYTLARPSGGILTGSTGTPRVCDPRGRGGADRHSVSSCLLGAPGPCTGSSQTTSHRDPRALPAGTLGGRCRLSGWRLQETTGWRPLCRGTGTRRTGRGGHAAFVPSTSGYTLCKDSGERFSTAEGHDQAPGSLDLFQVRVKIPGCGSYPHALPTNSEKLRATTAHSPR